MNHDLYTQAPPPATNRYKPQLDGLCFRHGCVSPVYQHAWITIQAKDYHLPFCLFHINEESHNENLYRQGL